MAEDLMERPFEGPIATVQRLHSPTKQIGGPALDEAEVRRNGGPTLDEAEVRRNVAKLVVFGFQGKTINSHACRLISLGAGGVILFARNVEDPYQVAQLCADLKSRAGSRPLITMLDQEGGKVQRLGPPFSVIPSASKVGSTGDAAAAGAIGSVIGRELRSVFVDLNLAPVLDVDTRPPNPILSDRCFSSSPDVVAAMGYAFIRAIQREGVAACAKHFPGLGQCSVDSHLSLPSFTAPFETLAAVDIPPFRKAVEADVAAVMVGHIDVPGFRTGSKKDEIAEEKFRTNEIAGEEECRTRGIAGEEKCQRKQIAREDKPPLPATLSASAIAYLRDELQFEGLVISDSLEMGAVAKTMPVHEAAVQAVAAGIDMVMVCHKEAAQKAVIDSLASSVLNGRLSYERVKEAGSRVERFAEQYCGKVTNSRVILKSGYQLARMDCIGCKEHGDLVANVLHHPAFRE